MNGIRGYNAIGFPSPRGVDADAVMKILYANEHNLFGRLYEGSPTFRTIPRDTNGQGKAYDQPYFVGTGGAVSFDFKVGFELAVNQAVGPGYASAKFGWDNQHAHWSIDTKQKKQMPARGKGSYISAMRQLMERAKERMERLRLAHIFGDGSGAIGQIDGAPTGVTNTEATFKLTTHTQTIYFEQNVTLEFASSRTTTTVHTGGAAGATQAKYVRITAVDRKRNTVTVKAVDDDGSDQTSTAANLRLLLADNTYIFNKGDVVNIPATGPDGLSPYTGTRVFGGFDAWRPLTLPTNDSFYGINRNQDPVRLSGVVHEVSAVNAKRAYQETIIAACYLQRTLGGRLANIVMNPLHFRDFQFELGDQVEYKKMDVSGSNQGVPGFRAIKIAYGQGDIMIHQDIHCPPGQAWGYVPSDWKLCSLDQFIHIWNEDGRVVDRIQGENKVGGAISSYAALICKNPINLARIKLPDLNQSFFG